MPLTKRLVEPVHVSREKIPHGIQNELEFVTNNTLANVILQLSSLSKHAEDMFGELQAEAAGFIDRASSIQNRINRLSVKIQQLDSNVEEVTLQDISLKKQFRSANVCDDRVVSRHTMPNAMKELYDDCDAPPPLDKLNPYRSDGREGLKFYTDPDYFFDLWKQKMLDVGDRSRHDRARKPGRSRASSENRTKKVVREPQDHREQMRAKVMSQEAIYSASPVQQYPGPQQGPMNVKSSYSYDQYNIASHNVLAAGAGNYDMNKYGTIRSQTRPGKLDLAPLYSPRDALSSSLGEVVHMVDYRAPANMAVQSPQPSVSEAMTRQQNTRGTPTRPSQPPPAPPSTGSGSLSTRSTPTPGREVLPPPPPEMQIRQSPPPPHQDFPPPPGAESAIQFRRTGPAAPPPPPPPPMGTLPIISAGSALPTLTTTIQHTSRSAEVQREGFSRQPPLSHGVAPMKVINNTMVDARSDLLAAIRSGIKLRKVEQEQEQQSKKSEPGKSSLHNVAEVMLQARRKAMQSDTDTDSSPDSGSEWGEGHS